MKITYMFLAFVLLSGCSEKIDYSQSVVFSGGDYKKIKTVRIQNDGSWIGISYEGDCVPSTIFYKRNGDVSLSRFDREETGCFGVKP